MAPLVILTVVFALLRSIGLLGWNYFDSWHTCLQAAVAAMFLLTASAHWGAKRAELIAMVPRSFSRPGLIVTVTGWLEIAGAIGIVVPDLCRAASVGLALLLLAMFPANVRAARLKLTIGGRPTPTLRIRSVLQLVFLAAVLLAG